MPGSVTIQGVLPGTTSGTVYVGPYTLVPNTNAFYTSQEFILASGGNTIGVPAWAEFMLIVPSPTNTEQLILKGVTGDTGILLGLTTASLVTLNPSEPQTTFNIAAAGATTVTVIFS